jgi:hypothetical protein
MGPYHISPVTVKIKGSRTEEKDSQAWLGKDGYRSAHRSIARAKGHLICPGSLSGLSTH